MDHREKEGEGKRFKSTALECSFQKGLFAFDSSTLSSEL